MDLPELVAYTKFKPSYIYKLTCLKQIPYIKHGAARGGKIYFEKDKIDSWLFSNSFSSDQEKKTEASTYVTTHP